MQPRDISGDRCAQLGDTEVLGVEGLARGDRSDRRVADVCRRYLIRLAEPEWQDVGVAHSGIGDLADLRCDQRAHRAPGMKVLRDESAIVHRH